MTKRRTELRQVMAGDPMATLGWPSDRAKGAALDRSRELRQRRELVAGADAAAHYVNEFCAARGSVCGEVWIGRDPNSGVPTLDLILRAR